MIQTKIVNLLGSCGSGKSTLAAGIFYNMKMKHLKVELVTEIAKDFCYEGRHNAMACQPYIFGKQLMRMERVLGQVDYLITDSPIFLSCIYNNREKYPTSFETSAVDIFKSMNNYNYYIKRVKPYIKLGRNQSQEEADALDVKIREYLKDWDIQFTELDGDEKAAGLIVEDILKY